MYADVPPLKPETTDRVDDPPVSVALGEAEIDGAARVVSTITANVLEVAVGVGEEPGVTPVSVMI